MTNETKPAEPKPEPHVDPEAWVRRGFGAMAGIAFFVIGWFDFVTGTLAKPFPIIGYAFLAGVVFLTPQQVFDLAKSIWRGRNGNDS